MPTLGDEWLIVSSEHMIECKKQKLEDWARCDFCAVFIDWQESVRGVVDESILDLEDMGKDLSGLDKSDEELVKDSRKAYDDNPLR